ncbi:MAG: NADP-dependent isocitrate dehydrogenase [Rikenellaceae bacterium]
MSNEIKIENGKLVVPDKVIIPFIEGDGIGVEITPAMQKIVDAAVKKAYNSTREIIWKELYASSKAEDKFGTPLPDETLQGFKDYIVGIKGPLFTPTSGGRRSLNVALRQDLDLFACVRPVKYYSGVNSPVRFPEKVNMTIFRENTEDIYAGIEWNAQTDEAKKFYEFLSKEMGVTKVRFPETSSFGVKPVSIEGSERLIRSAMEYAIENKKPSITIVHKGNIMKFTEGGFKKWGYELCEREFGDVCFTMVQYDKLKAESGEAAAKEALENAKASGKIIVKDVIADAFLQNALLYAEDYSVIVTLNLNGDYVSDMLAAQVGGIGIAPGANINYLTGYAIFEATHGTAPAIAGKDIANPCSMLLSAVMMLEYMGWTEAATLIDEAITNSFNNKEATSDLAQGMEGATSLSCSAFTNNILDKYL